jgi:hypothetical protein
MRPDPKDQAQEWADENPSEIDRIFIDAGVFDGYVEEGEQGTTEVTVFPRPHRGPEGER